MNLPAPTTLPDDDVETLWREVLRRRLEVLERRLDNMDERLIKHTEATDRIEANTADVVQTLASWNGAMRTLEGIGRVAKAIAAIVGMLATVGGAVWGMWQMLKGGGKA